ncbi:hypothetical protein TSOC_010912 [Tetrabaena socialis]|uniref:Uncharacterized protein n=1 Tax=Tetrabaena socialis TaxID=47790 RepID=A0A2J7ZS14_9CHLO|nr:hypothetical protein TSOC_010912 [Tetrabaena socialis]|eukprot:PNH03061.1 hypothetical protein TSOC_010912 [Tetrabaena socialis]
MDKERMGAQARRNPAVRRAAARLSYDLIAMLLCGLRPAFLLDYAPGAAAAAAVVAAAGEAAAAAGADVVVLTLDGCALLGRLDRLVQHLRGLLLEWARGSQQAQQKGTQEEQQAQQEVEAAEGRADAGAADAEAGGGAAAACRTLLVGFSRSGGGGGASAVPYVLSPEQAQSGAGSAEERLDLLPPTLTGPEWSSNIADTGNRRQLPPYS